MSAPIPMVRLTPTDPALIIYLADPATLPSGWGTPSDLNDGLSILTPMRTHAAAWERVMSSWDVGGKPCCFSHAPGTYDGIFASGTPVGVRGAPTSIYFVGDLSNPANCKLMPGSGTGAAIHLQGCKVYVGGFKHDMSGNQGSDAVIIEEGSTLYLGPHVVGPCWKRDFQPTIGSKLILCGNLVFDKGSSVGLNFIQQDPGSIVGASNDGVWGKLCALFLGTVTYTDSFISVDNATNMLSGFAWLQGATGFLTQTGPGFCNPSYTFPVYNIAYDPTNMYAYCPSLLYGSQVVSWNGGNKTVQLNAPLQVGTPDGTPIIFGHKANLGNVPGTNVPAPCYKLFGPCRMQSNSGADPTWLPGSAGQSDGRSAYYL